MSNHRRLLLSPLWLLVALVSTLGPGVTSAAAHANPETRVRAFEHATIDNVAAISGERPASVGCLRPVEPGFVSGSCVATEAVPGIKTPYGVAEQGTDAGSIALRGQVESGGAVYRQGVAGTQQTAEGQFWAGQNPASTPGYANSYGTPGIQVAQGEYPWIMGGTVDPGSPFVTRGAPGIGTNLGGAPEVVVNPGGVRNLWFHMPD